MQFEPSTAVYDACRVIRERVPEAQTGQGRSWLFLGIRECAWIALHSVAKRTHIDTYKASLF